MKKTFLKKMTKKKQKEKSKERKPRLLYSTDVVQINGLRLESELMPIKELVDLALKLLKNPDVRECLELREGTKTKQDYFG